MKEILFIGALDYGNNPYSGDVIKNRYLVEYFEKYSHKVDCIDTMHWRKNPLIILEVITKLLFTRINNVIISTSHTSAYTLIKFVNTLKIKKNFYYFMIGGYMQILLREGVYKKEYFRKLKYIIVEADKIKEMYNEIGIFNTIRVYNFKRYSYSPNLNLPRLGKVKFVFISRITKLKGIFIILEAVYKLNDEGYTNKFEVDFYGSVEEKIKEEFLSEVKSVTNVFYKGFMNLTDDKNYQKLSNYDAMLFPTLYKTEGFPGIIADAAIAGIPVIASNWEFAQELISDQNRGYIIPVGDADALATKMKYLIDNRKEAAQMRKKCASKAKEYHIDNVLTEKLLKQLELK